MHSTHHRVLTSRPFHSTINFQENCEIFKYPIEQSLKQSFIGGLHQESVTGSLKCSCEKLITVEGAGVQNSKSSPSIK